MPVQNFQNGGAEITLNLGDLNPKQKEFCQARSRYIAYGGARGGGKTHVLRLKAVMGALAYPGIRILVIRREYPELEQTVIIPMRRMVPAAREQMRAQARARRQAPAQIPAPARLTRAARRSFTQRTSGRRMQSSASLGQVCGQA